MSDPLLAAPYGNAHTTYRRGCLEPVVLLGTGPAIDTARSAFGVTLVSAPGGGIYNFLLPPTGRGLVFGQLLSATVSDVTINSYNTTTGALQLTTRIANGTATNLAGGDELWLLVMQEGG